MEADGYAEAYVPLSAFIAESDPEEWDADEIYTVYRRSNLQEKLGSIDPNDACLVVDSLQDAKQVVYPVTGSGYWKMGWIDTYVPEPELSGISLAAAPNKTSYYVGETLDTTGLLLTASFSDSSEKQISDGFTER